MMSDLKLPKHPAIIEMPQGGGALRPRPLSPSSVRAMAEQLALQLLAFAAAIPVGGGSQAVAIPVSASEEARTSLGAIDPVEYWVGIPEDEWRADTVDVGPPDGKLWLTVKEAQRRLGRSETTVRALIRDYPIGLMYGGQWVVNAHRAVAALYGRLPKKAGN